MIIDSATVNSPHSFLVFGPSTDNYFVDSTIGYATNALIRQLAFLDVTFINCVMPITGDYITTSYLGARGRIRFDHYDQELGTYRIYDNYGNIFKTACDGTGDAPSEDPDGGSDYCIEVSSVQSIVSTTYSLVIFDYDEYKIWCPADVAKTFTFKVQTTYAGISSGNLILRAEYLDGTIGGSTSIETSNSTAISQRSGDTDWTQTIAVTVTPAEEGFVRLRMEFCEYEANNELYIWPKVAIT
jgi:hypothetical protein